MRPASWLILTIVGLCDRLYGLPGDRTISMDGELPPPAQASTKASPSSSPLTDQKNVGSSWELEDRRLMRLAGDRGFCGIGGIFPARS
eukprot:CAMPEP_0114160040 /NCGR_PEP_ID=MMETSP0043_2-20121206/28125_1 /TAXON_ID=464988 /ORGANISM="Hemiselmis andersenii, Strain CCMP644" /LENGTH=87 /DNA_ID=CAMNT_0001256013 /DNA_START=215 /DNA_END=478 /DNA_ORIENTATION=-